MRETRAAYGATPATFASTAPASITQASPLPFLPMSAQAPTIKKRGRPTKLTPELKELFLKYADTTAPEVLLCEAAGITQETLCGWKNLALDGSKEHVEFFKQLRQKRAIAKIDKLKEIENNGEWRAKAWALERTAPEIFGRQLVEHSGRNGAPMEVVGLPPIIVKLEGAEGLPNPYEPSSGS